MKLLAKTFGAAVTVMGLLACSDTSTMITPQGVIPKVDYSEKPKGLEYFSPKVDILFVIDSSGSMSSAQNNLRKNAFAFADELSKMAVLDYHVGVITTDMEDCSRHCGQLVGMPTYVERTTPNMVATLSQRMDVGTGGSVTEMMFSPIMEAVGPRYQGGTNAGFIRPDAYLAVIIITDAAEQSAYSPREIMNNLEQLKGDKKKVLGYGVIRKLAEERICTTGGESLDGKLESFLSMVVNSNVKQENVLSICAPDYGNKLAEFARDIITRSAGSVKLSRLADKETIRVVYGTQVIPNDPHVGWHYRRSTNTLEFGSKIVWSKQPDGTVLSINYEPLEAE